MSTSGTTEISCKQLVERVTAYLEGALSAAETGALERHLEECEGCEAYLDQFCRTVDAVGGLREGGLDASAREGLLDMFRRPQNPRPASR